jgi:hypothetical protein
LKTPRKTKKNPASDETVLALISTAISLVSFLYFFRHTEVLLYGDAVAHINIARRVVDSLTPGPLQLGTVWLPLPHVLMLPFVASDGAWQSGIAGSLGSMLAFIFGAVGVYRLVAQLASRPAAWLAALIFAFNPNLVYMQATAMTESIYLAAMVWSIAYLMTFATALKEKTQKTAGVALVKCGIALAAAMYTRYDGWVLTACVGLYAAWMWLRSDKPVRKNLSRYALIFSLLVILPPVSWLAYNYQVFHNAFEFANGPYSARAIAERAMVAGQSAHPGYHSPWVAWIYFIKCAKLNVGDNRWQNVLLHIAVLAALLGALRKQWRVALLLWLPLPFYIFSIAYGGVPIFIPVWTPYSYYNVRYGLQLLPVIAVFTALGLELVLRVNYSKRFNQIAVAVFALAAALSYVSVIRAVPLCLREARVNAVTRVAFETALAHEMKLLPENATFMMYTGDHVGALQQAGVHLKRVVNENNWGYWQRALDAPARSADFIIAIEGDPVDAATRKHPDDLQELEVVHSVGKPPARIYASRARK